MMAHSSNPSQRRGFGQQFLKEKCRYGKGSKAAEFNPGIGKAWGRLRLGFLIPATACSSRLPRWHGKIATKLRLQQNRSPAARPVLQHQRWCFSSWRGIKRQGSAVMEWRRTAQPGGSGGSFAAATLWQQEALDLELHGSALLVKVTSFPFSIQTSRAPAKWQQSSGSGQQLGGTFSSSSVEHQQRQAARHLPWKQPGSSTSPWQDSSKVMGVKARQDSSKRQRLCGNTRLLLVK